MGPIVYRSRTVFEDATPELVRDFFWDDEFRPKWDPMLGYFKILEECPHNGTMIVHWIKKVCEAKVVCLFSVLNMFEPGAPFLMYCAVMCFLHAVPIFLQ